MHACAVKLYRFRSASSAGARVAARAHSLPTSNLQSADESRLLDLSIVSHRYSGRQHAFSGKRRVKSLYIYSGSRWSANARIDLQLLPTTDARFVNRHIYWGHKVYGSHTIAGQTIAVSKAGSHGCWWHFVSMKRKSVNKMSISQIETKFQFSWKQFIIYVNVRSFIICNCSEFDWSSRRRDAFERQLRTVADCRYDRFLPVLQLR